MKKIIFLIFYIAFASSCLQQMEAPESARVSGSWAVIDENNMTTSTLTFQGGYFEEYQSYRACYVEGKTVWGVDESTFERKSRNKYSLIDGVLYCADKSVKLVVENGVMTFGANKCLPIDDLNPSFYSEIVLSKTNKTSFLYSDREIEWHYDIENPVEGFNLVVKEAPEWCGGVKGVTVEGDKIRFTVQSTTENLSGKFVFSYLSAANVEVRVKQSAAQIALDRTSEMFDYSSATGEFAYTIPNKQEGYELEIKADVDWIVDIKNKGDKIAYSVLENNSGSERVGKITLTYAGVSADYTVTQKYSATLIKLSPSSATHTYAGGSYSFKYVVENPREGNNVSVSTPDSWITGVKDVDGVVSYTVSENNTGAARTGNVTLTYGDYSIDFTITQTFSAVSITLSPSSSTHDYTSGTYTFDYTISNPREGRKVSVSTSDSWITGVVDSNGTVSYSVAENNSGSSRTGKIAIHYAGWSKEFTVTQTYDAVSITLSPSSSTHDYTSGTYTFDYTISNPREGQKVSVSTSDSWIIVLRDVNGEVSYTVSENNSGVDRLGKVTVSYYGISKEFVIYQWGPPIDLSASGTANSYIVSSEGSYFFKPVKGNSSTSVGTVASVSVLWESFGTSTAPSVGDLVQSVSYRDGAIYFTTPSTFKEGNAVIAAKDASGKILWSWHIWFTDQPEGQVYYNNAGTMMDRNLGATSATPGDVGALGLLFQWGRKDPFLGSSSISSNSIAESTITWPSRVNSNSTNGTIAYAIANPTTFITYNDSNSDWYYTGSTLTDNTRWTTSESAKSIYDPCPSGWRVPDGGSDGVWAKAIGSSSSFKYTYKSTDEGMNFSGKFGSDQTIWYPASGYRYLNAGSLNFVGFYGIYWSASPNGNDAYCLGFYNDGFVYPSYYDYRAYGHSVRCLQE